MRKALSTQEAADAIGISKRQLLRWLYDGKIEEPRRERLGGIEVRLWSAADVREAQRFKKHSLTTRMDRNGGLNAEREEKGSGWNLPT